MTSRNKARQWIQNEAASSTLSSTPLLHVHIVLLAASICIHCIDTGGNIEEVQHCIWRRKRTNGNSAPEQSEDEGCKVDLGGIHSVDPHLLLQNIKSALSPHFVPSFFETGAIAA